MDTNIFSQLSLVIVIAAFVSLLMGLIRQPLILGYILTGLVVGPTGLNLIHDHKTFETFSDLGIALLLFIIGIGLNVTVIRRIGKTALTAAGTELVVIGTIGYVAAKMLGFHGSSAIIAGISLFFSSTIIIIKILTDKKEQNRLHGQIAIGVVLLDDIVATFALLFVAAGKDSGFSSLEAVVLVAKGVNLFLLLWLFSAKVLPAISRLMANSQEMLFLFAIAWGFGIASLFEFAGFSIEVGALFAGVSLASLPYAQEIEARLKPLRDFFVVLFFIVLGESLDLTNLKSALLPALALSAIVIVIKPTTIITMLGLLGYPKRVAFKAGINLSQISEFSIVLVVLATSAGMVDTRLSAVMTLVAIITIATSTYLMKYDNQLFPIFDRYRLRIFDRAEKHREKRTTVKYPFILFGYHRGGHEFVKTFQQMKKRFVVVDYNPTVIESLQHQHIPALYGDATDIELLDEVGVHTAHMIVSTITDFETNQELIRHINLENPDGVFICQANNYDEALQLYEYGATYVMLPHYVGSERLSSFIRKKGLHKDDFNHYREWHLSRLEANHPLSMAEAEEAV